MAVSISRDMSSLDFCSKTGEWCIAVVVVVDKDEAGDDYKLIKS